jgi:hypothetical protein
VRLSSDYEYCEAMNRTNHSLINTIPFLSLLSNLALGRTVFESNNCGTNITRNGSLQLTVCYIFANIGTDAILSCAAEGVESWKI